MDGSLFKNNTISTFYIIFYKRIRPGDINTQTLFYGTEVKGSAPQLSGRAFWSSSVPKRLEASHPRSPFRTPAPPTTTTSTTCVRTTSRVVFWLPKTIWPSLSHSLFLSLSLSLPLSTIRCSLGHSSRTFNWSSFVHLKDSWGPPIYLPTCLVSAYHSC